MWVIDIPEQRTCGVTRCCCLSATGLGLHRALAVFGLKQREESLIEVTAEHAQAILARLLAVSFVGHHEAMPNERALSLADEFVDAFKGGERKFYTNADWSDPATYAWPSLTDSLFDGGVIAYGPGVSACIWVEEDD